VHIRDRVFHSRRAAYRGDQLTMSTLKLMTKAIIDSPARPGEPITIIPLGLSDEAREIIDKLYVRGDAVMITIAPWESEGEE